MPAAERATRPCRRGLAHRDTDDARGKHRGAGERRREDARIESGERRVEEIRPRGDGRASRDRQDVGKKRGDREAGEHEHEADDRRDERVVFVVVVVAQRVARVLQLEERAPREVEASTARLLDDARQRAGERRLGDAFDGDAEGDRPSLGADDDAPAARLDLPDLGPRDLDRLRSIDAEPKLLERDLQLLLGVTHDDGAAQEHTARRKVVARLRRGLGLFDLGLRDPLRPWRLWRLRGPLLLLRLRLSLLLAGHGDRCLDHRGGSGLGGRERRKRGRRLAGRRMGLGGRNRLAVRRWRVGRCRRGGRRRRRRREGSRGRWRSGRRGSDEGRRWGRGDDGRIGRRSRELAHPRKEISDREWPRARVTERRWRGLRWWWRSRCGPLRGLGGRSWGRPFGRRRRSRRGGPFGGLRRRGRFPIGRRRGGAGSRDEPQRDEARVDFVGHAATRRRAIRGLDCDK